MSEIVGLLCHCSSLFQVVDRRKTRVLQDTVGSVQGKGIDWKRAWVPGGTPRGRKRKKMLLMKRRSTTIAQLNILQC